MSQIRLTVVATGEWRDASTKDHELPYHHSRGEWELSFGVEVGHFSWISLERKPLDDSKPYYWCVQRGKLKEDFAGWAETLEGAKAAVLETLRKIGHVEEIGA